MRAYFLFLLGALPALGQPFSIGAKVGVPLTDLESVASSTNISYSTTTNRYIIGVTGELRLPLGLAVEADALYRHLNYGSITAAVGGITASASTTGNAWEFPIVAKYRFPTRIVRPYVEAGVAWDTLQGLTQTVKTTVAGVTNSTSTSNPSELRHNTTQGFVMGAGVDIHALVIHIQPELRYTRWGSQHFLDPLGLLQSDQNQAEFLVGITF